VKSHCRPKVIKIAAAAEPQACDNIDCIDTGLSRRHGNRSGREWSLLTEGQSFVRSSATTPEGKPTITFAATLDQPAEYLPADQAVTGRAG